MSLDEIYLQTKYGKDYKSLEDSNLKRFVTADIKRLATDHIKSAKITLKRLGDPNEYVLINI